MEWLENILFGGAVVLVVLYVRGVFIELSERIDHNRTEANTRIDARVFKSDFEREMKEKERLLCALAKRVDELENGGYKLVRKDEDDDEDWDDEDDDDEDVITAENAEVALDYDDVKITVG